MNTNIYKCLINKNTNINPVWFMRQAGRYLPEFRKIRKENPNFIKLCLNKNLINQITLQPMERFNLDAAIIFSDILMLPYGLGQKVEFKKNFGPFLGNLNINNFLKISEEDFVSKLKPVYKAINITSKNKLIKNKDLIGFVGAPWTILIYMLNKKSPKKKISKYLFNDEKLINNLLKIIEKFLKIHIKNQINNGASIIQIFDSWAGLVEEKNLEKYVYNPTANLVEYVRSFKIPVICFPRNIKNYKKYCEKILPDAINIDYEIDPKKIVKEIKIPVQGGLDPKILLTDKNNLIKKTNYYLNIFKDHPYIFNLGHGVLPETDPIMLDYLVKYVKDFK